MSDEARQANLTTCQGHPVYDNQSGTIDDEPASTYTRARSRASARRS